MKENILDRYFCIIDGSNFDKEDELEPDDIAILRLERPIEIGLLIKYLRFIIKQMYEDLGSKEKVEEAVDKIKSEKIVKEKKYKWKDIYLEDLMNADFNYLKEKFLLKNDLVPDENAFINQYRRPEFDLYWPFTLKELYFYFLQKEIEIMIDNFSNYKKNNFHNNKI